MFPVYTNLRNEIARLQAKTNSYILQSGALFLK